jgi:hypothetical protein
MISASTVDVMAKLKKWMPLAVSAAAGSGSVGDSARLGRRGAMHYLFWSPPQIIYVRLKLRAPLRLGCHGLARSPEGIVRDACDLPHTGNGIPCYKLR